MHFVLTVCLVELRSKAHFMSTSTKSYRFGAVLTVAGGLAGAAIALYAYLTPLTGITGTGGALLVIVSSLLVAAAGVIIALVASRFGRNALRVLTGLGILGTAAAAGFLHQPFLIAAMVLAAIGLILDCMHPARDARTMEGALL